MGSTTTPAAFADEAVTGVTSNRAVSMVLHTHSCFSEGGSWAAGGGGASMMAQLEQAVRNDIDVVWWTDHDWRMEAYGYYDGIAFDGTDENGGLQWFVQNDGAVTDAEHAFVDDPHSPNEPGKALRVSASGPQAEWGASFLWAKAGNSFYSTNLSDTTFTVDVLGERIGPDAELVVQLETSYRPATAGRPAGVYVLEYRLAATAGRSLADPLIGVVAVKSDGGWQRLTMHPVDDIRAFWPDLVAEDSGLARSRFGVRARNGATASGVFDRLRIDRTRDPLHWPIRTQRDLMRQLRSTYPGVTQLLSAEVSMVRHMNVFMEDFELYPYPTRGKAPVLDNSVEAAEAMVAWYHERGALVQYNHPPINPAELVASRALGADLIEVANADGDFTVIRDRIDQYDVAARNAIFLTATSQVDDHGGRDWQEKPHLYTTAVWAGSRQARELLTALPAARHGGTTSDCGRPGSSTWRWVVGGRWVGSYGPRRLASRSTSWRTTCRRTRQCRSWWGSVIAPPRDARGHPAHLPCLGVRFRSAEVPVGPGERALPTCGGPRRRGRASGLRQSGLAALTTRRRGSAARPPTLLRRPLTLKLTHTGGICSPGTPP
ncbi:hypothetical protein ABZV93_18455 [Actinopolymorpha sp. NPDC004070]|uniref:hypothetical protein n=1 Tax=Actinopolymorpha sp. NPDC004070 TaxID=3154548 RepID=UPI00339EC251